MLTIETEWEGLEVDRTLAAVLELRAARDRDLVRAYVLGRRIERAQALELAAQGVTRGAK